MSDADDTERLKLLKKLNFAFADHVLHNKALGIQIESLTDSESRLSLPYSEDLIGNPETRVLHGGAITALLDACCGSAVFMALKAPTPIATLDLRIDYLKPATPDATVFGHAHCYKVTRHVAFVRCTAFHEDENDPIATATGTFMLGTKLGRGDGSPEPKAAR